MIERCIDLFIKILALGRVGQILIRLFCRYTDMFLSILDSLINELGVFRFLRCRKNQRRIGCGILRFVFGNCYWYESTINGIAAVAPPGKRDAARSNQLAKSPVGSY